MKRTCIRDARLLDSRAVDSERRSERQDTHFFGLRSSFERLQSHSLQTEASGEERVADVYSE